MLRDNAYCVRDSHEKSNMISIEYLLAFLENECILQEIVAVLDKRIFSKFVFITHSVDIS